MATPRIAVLCLYVLGTVYVSGQTLSGSNSSYAVLNRPFQFTCTGSVTTTTLAFNRDGTSLCTIAYPSDPARCAEFTSSPGYSCSCGSSGVFYMDIANVSVQDEDRWKCGTGDFFNLPVYYAPSIDKSRFPSPYTAVKGRQLSVNCASYTKLGRPSSTSYTWTHVDGSSTSGSTLQVNNLDTSGAGQYTCRASNNFSSSKRGQDSATLQLIVQFAPKVSGKDPSYPVRELSPLIIDCRTYTTAGNPPSTSYRWTGPNSFSSSQPILSFSSSSRNQSGIYTCRVANTLTPTGGIAESGIGEGQFSVDVQYKPSVFGLPDPFYVTEHTNLSLDCSSYTQSNPAVTSYRWTGPGGHSSVGPVLSISSINRDKTGDFTCTAANSIGTGTGFARVNVQYGPGSSVSISPQAKLERVEGSGLVTVTCSADCFPPCSFKWVMGNKETESHQLHISNVSRIDGGSYSCEAWNGVGERARRDFVLDVIYMDIPLLTISPPEVTENASVHLECRVSSNPTVEMTISNVDNNTNLVDGEMTNTRQLDIDRAQCLHNGTFQCVVNNRALSRSETVTRQLNVLCLRRYDVRKEHFKEVAVELNGTAQLVARVIANPPPKFTWGGLEGNDLLPIRNSTVYTVHSNELKSVLQIKVTSSKDYGQYAVKVQNKVGETLLKYQLTAKGLPFPPTSFRASSVGPTSVTLKWTSNYNGGALQTFQLKFRSYTDNWINTLENGIPDPGENSTVSTEVTDLKVSTRYGFIIFSTNVFGSSQKLELNVTTAEAVQSTSQSSNVGVIAGLVTAICLLSMVALVLFFLYRRGVLQGSLCFKREKRGPLTSVPVAVNQGTSDLTTTYASPYSDLDHMNSERQTYAELKTYQNHQAISDYEESINVPGTKLPTYENTNLKKKDPLYINVSSN